MPGILFDLDGVFYVGDEAIPGARETLDWVESNRIPH
jgi:ribonucleotide monophosphatase NagD (HAD superfamily)